MAAIQGVQSSQERGTENASTNDAMVALGGPVDSSTCSHVAEKVTIEAGNDQRQRPPELSRGGGEDGGGAGKVGEDTTTLDLHYADPDIVGSWRVHLVQAGLCDRLVERCVAAVVLRKPCTAVSGHLTAEDTISALRSVCLNVRQ